MMTDNVLDATSPYRCTNFNAGPSAISLSVLERAQRELLNYAGTGVSICETSHRSASFNRVMTNATEAYRSLLDVPSSHEVLFAQGGGTGQTAAILYNSVDINSGWAAYAVTGKWSFKAYEESQKLQFRAAVLTEPFAYRIQSPAEWGSRMNLAMGVEEGFQMPSNAPSLVHHCTNETIDGLELHQDPKDACLNGFPDQWKSHNTIWSMDASSNFCSRPIDVSNYDIIYAGAQKNVGTSGISIIVANKRRFSNGPKTPCPSVFDYSILMKNKSLHNTIPVFPMYITGLVAQDLINAGGLKAAEQRAVLKSGALYDAIDNSDGFYKCTIEKASRSRMNIVFRICAAATGDENCSNELPNLDAEALFVKQAEDNGMIGLKGHRSVGGLRASLYNAVSINDVDKLIAFMQNFQEDIQSRM